MARILVADDESSARRVLGVILKEEGHTVIEAEGVERAFELFRSVPLDLVISDQKMPDGSGMALLASCREEDPTIPIVMLTAFASVELAVQAMREGAFDFLTKPYTPDVVRGVVRRAVERTELLRENQLLKREVERQDIFAGILGTSAAIQQVKALIQKVARTNATVLITGETGSGKELAARAIHKGSARAEKPFVAVNCSAFPEPLLESQLFGHEKGAFTGADKTRHGLFEAAHLGTLFLDEAGEMSLPLQAKLLRVVVDGEFTRVGSTVSRTVDVRIVVATHRDLWQRTRDGLFREDLYYRLAVVPIQMPALRERRDDIPLLAEHFLRSIETDENLPQRRLSSAASESLMDYAFPGNVRELRNLVERANILASSDVIGPEHFPVSPSAGYPSTGPNSAAQPSGIGRWVNSLPAEIALGSMLAEIEKALLVRALSAAGGVQAVAARRLGISRSDMRYKMKKYDLML
ncbi:sigma-54-dependent Fis family transcriptional regulator [candidate division KSB1 bacterium]|nr:sigma-54-dependent Fis family transcriptional regulator [candidate division KSB1 bacterium]